eukprot:NODE_10247_length_1366_cov_3.733656.p1 GENE.NODE_10247_length_1366_cov_3.733656~~NODE_10247_length_1366_cov_3.733656.p1  ORF type:complete len:298 (-),score=62.27 NODE_10247_length_1366_cov_3.733656:107-1000(-)
MLVLCRSDDAKLRALALRLLPRRPPSCPPAVVPRPLPPTRHAGTKRSEDRESADKSCSPTLMVALPGNSTCNLDDGSAECGALNFVTASLGHCGVAHRLNVDLPGALANLIHKAARMDVAALTGAGDAMITQCTQGCLVTVETHGEIAEIRLVQFVCGREVARGLNILTLVADQMPGCHCLLQSPHLCLNLLQNRLLGGLIIAHARTSASNSANRRMVSRSSWPAAYAVRLCLGVHCVAQFLRGRCDHHLHGIRLIGRTRRHLLHHARRAVNTGLRELDILHCPVNAPLPAERLLLQ